MKFYGNVFRALSSKKEEGSIELYKGKACIKIGKKEVCNNIAIKSIQGKKDIYLENDFLFTLLVPLDFEQEKQILGKVKTGITWLENFSNFKAVILSFFLISLLSIFIYAFKSMTPLIVSIFPHDWENIIGRNVYHTLKKTVFTNTELSSIKIEKLRSKAKKLALVNGFNSPQIIFHKSKLIGPNALAFPGGPIVLTDSLVKLLQKDDLILGVIAHEFAHVQERHSLHQILELIGISVIASALLGSDETLIEEASFVGINLWTSKKSREFEKQADLKAIEYLQKSEINQSSLLLALKKLISYFCSSTFSEIENECFKKSESNLMSTHPSFADRQLYLSNY